MTAKTIKNVSDTPFRLGANNIDPGKTVRVDDFENFENDDMLKAWVHAGAIVVTDATPRSTKQTGPTEEEAEAGRITAERKGTREDAKLNEAVFEEMSAPAPKGKK